MSQKSVTPHYKTISDGDMSGPLTSLPTNVVAQDNCAYQVIYTGSPTGNFTVEATVDGVNWSALVFSPAITTINSASPFLINMNQLPYRQIRLRYTPTSGSGTLQVWFSSKRLGG